MNQEIKKIFEQYFCGNVYQTEFVSCAGDGSIYEEIYIDKKFHNGYPIYIFNIYTIHPYCLATEKIIKTSKNNIICPFSKTWFSEQLSDSLKFFDYYEDKKNFIEYENKKILQTIFLILRKKIPFLSIILILSFIRTVHLGNTLYLKKYEEIPYHNKIIEY